MFTDNFKAYLKTALAVIVFVVIVYILPSPLSLIFEFFAIAFFAKIVLMHHYSLVAAIGALILAISAAFGGVNYALVSGIASGITIVLLGLSLGMGKRLNLSYYKILFICTFLYLASTAGGILLAKSASVDILSLESFYEIMNSAIDSMAQNGYAFTSDMLDAISAYLKTIVLFMMQITPAMLIIISALLAFVLIQIYKYVLIKAKIDVRFFVSVDKMRAGKISGIVFLVIVFLYSAAPVSMISDVLLNVMIVMGFLFFACGFSLFDWQLKMRGTKKSTRRFMEICILPLSYMFMMMPVLALLVMGLSDSFLNFRKRSLKKQN